MRALVIDDSGAMRSILRQYMRELKYEVVEARDGREALERCEQTPDFDIALVDWNMPVMNGLEFVRALRAKKEFDSMKLMMVTTENDVAHIEAALSAGANEFVMKPFTYEVLEEKMALLNDSM
ncbi:MAG TPA: response regulator [Candidatus Angelobacter sp.]|jgi:two-component system chemotaxis response regulator CheY|nr:response regulator [Candidatus Angelobacter sp.]